MLLVLAIIVLVGSLLLGGFIGFGNMMSDAPTEKGFSQAPTLIGVAISAAIFAGWYFGS